MWSGYGVVIVIESMMDWGRDWGSSRGYISIIVIVNVNVNVSIDISIFNIFIIFNISIDLLPTLM